LEISYDPDGRASVSRYDVGDFVRLRVSEGGEGAVGRAGDWGVVVAVDRGLGGGFDIQIAGYSESRTSPVKRLTGLTRRIVVPCDRRGVPIALPERVGLGRADAGLRQRRGTGGR